MASVTHTKVATGTDNSADQVSVNAWNAQHVVSGVRTEVTVSTTYYVRTTGNDSNDGLTPATAWLTIGHAFDYIDGTIDVIIPSTGQITIDIGPGTFAGGTFFPSLAHLNGSFLQIQGASTTTTFVNDGFQFINLLFANVVIQTLCLQAFSGGGALIGSPPGAFITITAAKFDMGAVYNAVGCCELTGGSANVNNCDITGNGDFVAFVHGAGGVTLDTLNYITPCSFVDAVMRISFGGIAQDFLGHTGIQPTGYKYTCEGYLWFPFGGGDIQAGKGSLLGIITAAGQVYTGTDFHHKPLYSTYQGGIYRYVTPTTGFSITLTDTDFHTLIDPAGALASGTITMSPAPLNWQTMDLRFSQVVTSLTFVANAGQSLLGAPSTATNGQVMWAVYMTANSTWYFTVDPPAGPNNSLQFNTGGRFAGDAGLIYPSTGQLLLSNGTSPAKLQVYNTVDSSASPVNYERGVMDWTTTANFLTVGIVPGGTGNTNRNMRILGSSGGNGQILFNVGVTDICAIDGHFTGGLSMGVSVITWGASLTTYAAGLCSNAAKVVAFTDSQTYNTNGWFNYQGQARATGDFPVTSSAILINVTGLTCNVQAGRTYTFEAMLLCTDAAAGGVQAAIAGTATATNIIYEGYTLDSNTIKAQTQATALGTAVGSTTTTGTTPSIRIQGTITVNQAGTLTVQFAQNTSNITASTVKQGSYFLVQDMK